MEFLMTAALAGLGIWLYLKPRTIKRSAGNPLQNSMKPPNYAPRYQSQLVRGAREQIAAKPSRASKEPGHIAANREDRRMPPPTLPFGESSFTFQHPGDFEMFEMLSESNADIRRQLDRMRDSVAANILIYEDYSTRKVNIIIEGYEDPVTSAKRKLALWKNYADYVGVSDVNFQRAREAFVLGKVKQSLADGAFVIFD